MFFSHKMQEGCETLSVFYVMKADQMKWDKFSEAHEMALLSHSFTHLWCYTVQLLIIQLLAGLCHGRLHPHSKALFVYLVCLQQAAVCLLLQWRTSSHSSDGLLTCD